jgi:tRNA pseudouridine55 synthase
LNLSALVMNGILIVDKPAGPTSFDVVRRVRSLLKVEKAGHTGTLDPMATGVLPICVGAATKIAGLISEGRKSYDALIRLGIETDTQDAAGKVIAEGPVPQLTAQLLEAVLAKFRGSYLQVPPMFSAVKVGGKRLHELAREGEEVHREARPVEVYELAVRDFSAAEISISLTCSKGFFVRALAHDIGKELHCGAHLKALRRTRSGPFALEQAVGLAQLAAIATSEGGAEVISKRLISANQALAQLPAICVSQADAQRVVHGVPIEAPPGTGTVRVVGPDGALLAIAELGKGARLSYRRVLVELDDNKHLRRGPSV